MNSGMKRISLVLCVILCSVTAKPQRVSHVFKGESLAKALRVLDHESTDYRINFIFDELEDFVVTTSFKNKSIPNAVRDVVGFYPIRIVTDEKNRNIFIECMQKKANKLIGRLTDQYAEPVVYANVALLNVRDSTLITGGVSNESGDFVIPTNRTKVLMRVSCVGYQTLYDTVSVGNIGTVRMQVQTFKLKTVQVKGFRPAYQIGKEGIVAHVQGTNLSHAGTAEDVLGMLPNLSAEDGYIAIFGKSGRPTIFINGKKVLHNDELSLLKSEDIGSIEVITTPGIRYDATATAVIKIKTVKKKGDGWSCNLQAMGRLAHRESKRGDADVNYRTGGLDISTNVAYADAYRRQEQETFWNIRNVVSKQSLLTYDDHSLLLNGKVQMNYVFNAQHAAGITYDFKRSRNAGYVENRIHSAPENDSAEDYVSVAQLDHLHGPAHGLSAYYNGSIGKLGVSADVDYTCMQNGVELWAQARRTSRPNTVNAWNRNSSCLFAFKNALSYNLWKGTLNAGCEYTGTQRYNRFCSAGDTEMFSDDKIKEYTAAFFIGYDAKWKSFSASLGVRHEHTDTRHYRFGILKKRKNPNNYHWFPAVSLGYQQGKASFRFSYAVETQRPSYAALTGNRMYKDEYIYEGGNPLLHSSRIHSLSLMAQYRRLTFCATYSDIYNDIVSMDRPYGEKAILYTPVNVPHRRNLNVLIAFSNRIGIWKPNYSVGFNKQFFELFLPDKHICLCQPYWAFKLYNTFYLPKGLLADLRCTVITAGHELALYRKARGVLSVSLYKSFLKEKLSVSLKVNDLLRSQRRQDHYQGLYMDFNRNSYLDSRHVSLTVTYHLNGNENKYKGKGAGKKEKGRL